MKKIIASAGIAAVGAAALQAAPQVGSGSTSSTQTSKPWSLSASLRAFYDDNITTIPDALESYGIEFSPSISYSIIQEQTEIELGYRYGLRWYEDREPDSEDHSHTVSANISHSASPSLSFKVGNTLRIAQEPRVETGTGIPIRGLQDYLDNEASIYATKALGSTRYSVNLGYSNRVLNFDDPAFSTLLDRMEHTPLIHLLAQLNPSKVEVIGYRFKSVN